MKNRRLLRHNVEEFGNTTDSQLTTELSIRQYSNSENSSTMVGRVRIFFFEFLSVTFGYSFVRRCSRTSLLRLLPGILLVLVVL